MGEVDPAVVPGDEMKRVGGGDPERMVVGMEAGADGLELLASVGGDMKTGRLNIDNLVIRGVDPDMAILKGAGVNRGDRWPRAGKASSPINCRSGWYRKMPLSSITQQ